VITLRGRGGGGCSDDTGATCIFILPPFLKFSPPSCHHRFFFNEDGGMKENHLRKLHS
jgi:hypothetical protein